MMIWAVPTSLLFLALGAGVQLVTGRFPSSAFVPVMFSACLLTGSLLYGLAESHFDLDPARHSFLLGLISATAWPPVLYVTFCLVEGVLLPITLIGLGTSVAFVAVAAFLWRFCFVGRSPN